MFLLYQMCKDFSQTPSSYLFEGIKLSSHERMAVDKEVLVIARNYESELREEQEKKHKMSSVRNRGPDPRMVGRHNLKLAQPPDPNDPYNN